MPGLLDPNALDPSSWDPNTFQAGVGGQPPWLTSMMQAPLNGPDGPSGWGRVVSLEGGRGPGRPTMPRYPYSRADGSDDDGAGEELPPTSLPASGASDGSLGRGEARRGPMGFGDILSKIGDMVNARSGTLMALGAGMLGAPSSAIGLSRGLSAALPAMQQDIAQGKQNQTVQALVARGLSPEMAQAVVGNPATLGAFLQRQLGIGKQYQHVTITDAMGQQHVFAFDPDTGQMKEVQGQGGGGQGMGDPSLTGQPFLDSLKNPMLANEIRAAAEGRVPIAPRNLQRLTPLITQYDPTFNAQDYNARNRLLTSFKSGKDADAMVAINTVGGHLNDLYDAAMELNNSGFRQWNKMTNFIAGQTDDPRINRFKIAYNAVLDELGNAYRAGHVTDSEKRSWEDSFDVNSGPKQMSGSIAKMADLLQSKINALSQKYTENMGPLAPPVHMTSDKAKATFEEMPKRFEAIRQRDRGVQHGDTPSSTTGAPATYKPGTVINLDKYGNPIK